MKYRADFHVHSCLSPCGELEMAPSALVARAGEVGLTALALTDHNTAKNSPAFAACCQRAGITYLPGMEVSTREEAHVLCLFDSMEAVMELDQIVYDHLPDVMNDAERFGDQVIVNEHNEIEGVVDKYLISSVDLSVEELLVMVHERDGLFIPAHVDRPYFSLTSQLGFIPSGAYDAVEVSPHYDLAEDRFGLKGRYGLVSNSDAHSLDAMGRLFNDIEIDQWSVKALREYWCVKH